MTRTYRLERTFVDEWGREERHSVCEWDGATALDSNDRTGPSPCLTGTNIETWTGYGSDGLARETAGPYYEGESTPTALTDRDGLGRPVMHYTPGHDNIIDWEVTETAYQPGKVVVIDPLGRETVHWADTLGGEVEVSGVTTTAWEVDAYGDLLWVEDFDGRITDFQVDDFHRRADARLSTQEQCVHPVNSTTSACDNWAGWIYDAMDRVVREAYSDGSATEYAYDPAGRVLAQDHDDGGALTPLGAWVYTDYPSAPLPRVDFTAELGTVTTLWSDAFGRPHERQDLLGTTTWAYGSTWGADSRIDVDGIELAWTYDVHDRTVETTRMNDGVITLSVDFDADGQPATVEDADGVIDEYWYTYSRQLRAVDRGSWVLQEHEYDVAGRLVDATTEGVRKTLTLDDWDRPQVVDFGDPAAPEWTETRTWTGNMVDTVTLTPVHSGSGTTTYHYDTWSRLDGVTHPDGSYESFEYDRMERLRFHVDEMGGENERRWDTRSRLTYTKDTGEGGTSVQWFSSPSTWDGVPNLQRIEERDALGNAWNFYLDEGGRQIGEVAPNGTATRFTHGGTLLLVEEARDPSGIPLARRSRGHNPNTAQVEWIWGWFDDLSWYPGKLPGSTDYVVDYSWTDAGRLDSVATPDETTTFTYVDGYLGTETWGGVQSRTLARTDVYPWVTAVTRTGTGNARVTTYARDTAGRIVSETVTRGSASLVNSWSNLDGLHNPQVETSVVNGVTTVVHDWLYDGRGRPIERDSLVHGAAAGTTAWGWYANGTALSVGTPAGRSVEYVRNLYGGEWLLDDVKVNGAIEATFQVRDLMQRPLSIQLGAGVLNRTYDNMGRLATQTGSGPWGSSSWVGTYDHRDRLVQEDLVDSTLGTWGNTYEYVEPGWLEVETRGLTGDVYEYDYDAAGRRTAKWTNGTQTQTLSWNGSIPSVIDGTSLAYDGLDGVDTDQVGFAFDRLADGHVDAIYDASSNLLTEMYRDSGGLVVESDEGGSVTRLTSWGLRQGEYPIEVRESSGGDRTYVTAEGLLLGVHDGSSFSSAFGEPARDILRTGTVVQEETSAFGAGAAGETFSFAGLEAIPGASHLKMAQHRVVDVSGGHFQSTDFLGLLGGPHRLRYADGDPVSRFDPQGLKSDTEKKSRKKAKKTKRSVSRGMKKETRQRRFAPYKTTGPAKFRDGGGKFESVINLERRESGLDRLKARLRGPGSPNGAGGPSISRSLLGPLPALVQAPPGPVTGTPTTLLAGEATVAAGTAGTAGYGLGAFAGGSVVGAAVSYGGWQFVESTNEQPVLTTPLVAGFVIDLVVDSFITANTPRPRFTDRQGVEWEQNSDGSWKAIAVPPDSDVGLGATQHGTNITGLDMEQPRDSKSGLTRGDAIRIQQFADRYQVDVYVVGSRARNTHHEGSDYDYVIPNANSKMKRRAKEQLPRGHGGGELGPGGFSGIDIYTIPQPYPGSVYVKFEPE